MPAMIFEPLEVCSSCARARLQNVMNGNADDACSIQTKALLFLMAASSLDIGLSLSPPRDLCVDNEARDNARRTTESTEALIACTELVSCFRFISEEEFWWIDENKNKRSTEEQKKKKENKTLSFGSCSIRCIGQSARKTPGVNYFNGIPVRVCAPATCARVHSLASFVVR